MIEYNHLHYLVHEAQELYGDDPLYLQLKEQAVDVDSVVLGLRATRLRQCKEVVPPDGV